MSIWTNDTVIVAASFGTVHDRTASDNITSVEEAFADYAPCNRIVRAYTSPTIRRILKQRGIIIESVSDCLNTLSKEGVRKVVVQPTHLIPGEEYDKLCAEVLAYRTVFEELYLGKPLMANDEDIKETARILCQEYPLQAEEGILWMGHGSPHPANRVYQTISDIFRHEFKKERMFLATVEGTPTLLEVLPLMTKQGIQKVHLIPLMLVAGEHAVHDMAGEQEESWKNQVKRAGFEPICHFCGIGELTSIRALYCRHLDEAKRVNS